MAQRRPGGEFGVGPLYNPEKVADLTPNIVSNVVETAIMKSEDIFRSFCEYLDFSVNDDLDLLIIDDGIGGIPVREKVLDSDTEFCMYMLQTLDFVPTTLQNPRQSYKIKSSNRKFKRTMVGVGGNEGNDQEIVVDFVFEITSNVDNILNYLYHSFPILRARVNGGDPIYCAIKRSKDDTRVQIVGVFGVEGIRGKFGSTGHERVEHFASRYGISKEDSKLLFDTAQRSICSATAYFATLIHESARKCSQYTITVGASVLDRVSTYEPHIPLNLFSKELALSKPISFDFSSAVVNEIKPPIPADTCYTIFRDQNAIYVSEKSRDRWAKIIRFPIEVITNIDNRITAKKITVAVNQALSLKRGGEMLSVNRALNANCKYEPFNSQVSNSLWYWMKNIQFTGFSSKIDRTDSEHRGDWLLEINTDDDSTVRLAKLTPIILRLSLGLFDPFLTSKENIKTIEKKVDKKRKHSPKKGRVSSSRIFKWGSDKIRYVVLKSGNERQGAYWVKPHSHTYNISRPETIERYRLATRNNEPGYGLFQNKDGNYIGIRTVGDYWCNADGVDSTWDGTYNFGKNKRYSGYSKMAIEWIKSLEEKLRIKILHAEQGGEYRLKIGTDKETGKDKYIWLDGYCEENHTAYEFHGDMWHGNPKIYSREEKCHPHFEGIEGTAGYLYDKTIEREQAIRDLGFNLVTIWENDWKNSNHVVEDTS